MPASFVMMGAQFENVSGDAVKLSEIDFGTNFTGPSYGNGPDEYALTAPQVQLAFANKEGVSTYYFLSDGKLVGPGDEDFGPGWVDVKGNEADPDVSVGLGFWFKDAYNTDRAVNNAGGVLMDESWEKTFNVTFRMLVCPYPKAVALSDINFVDIETGAPSYESDYTKTATQIQIPFASKEGFSTYYFLSDGVWVGPGEEDFGPGWVDVKGNQVDASEVMIPAGRGCWFRPLTTGSDMTVIFE